MICECALESESIAKSGSASGVVQDAPYFCGFVLMFDGCGEGLQIGAVIRGVVHEWGTVETVVDQVVPSTGYVGLGDRWGIGGYSGDLELLQEIGGFDSEPCWMARFEDGGAGV